jgi:hypothetical protein
MRVTEFNVQLLLGLEMAETIDTQQRNMGEFLACGGQRNGLELFEGVIMSRDGSRRSSHHDSSFYTDYSESQKEVTRI